MKKLLLQFLFLLLFISASAQISGTVKDKKTGKPLADVEVFINNSSWLAISDKDGAFALDGISPGFFDLVLYKKGFEIFKSSMRIQEGKLYKLTLELTTEVKQPSSKIKRDQQWNTHYEWFLGGLLGSNEFARLCEVDNNSSVQFQVNEGTLHATASEPFTIKNLALGLELRVFLQSMKAGNASSDIRALIHYKYRPSSDYQQLVAWERNRLKSYWGTPRHLFKSLIEGVAGNEGYTLSDVNGQPVSFQDMASKGNVSGYYKLNLPNPVKVKFQIDNIGTTVVAAEQLSEISFEEGFEVNASGLPFSAVQYRVKGAMEPFGLSSSLPIDYEPSASIENEKMDWKNFSMLREKVYLHTDRDYYYPRETIWFKSYMGYSLPLLRDTLSGVLYVDLISPDKERIDTRTYRIKEGVTWGEFYLTESLPAGEYYLRAYTNWMRNYGDSALFIKQIPILALNTNIDQQKQEFPAKVSPLLQVKADQESYAGRKQVSLQIHLHDERGLPVAGNLSVAVTDAVTSAMLNQSNIITPSALAISDLGIDNKFFDEIKYYMERGLSFRGVVKDNKGLPTPAKIDIIQGNMDNLVSMETDDKGEFLLTGLHFTDSILFAFKPVNAKGKPLPRVDLLANEIPELNFKLSPLSFQLKDDNAIQRIQNVYAPDKNTIMLNEVEVKSSRLADGSKVEPVRIYGTADYVIKGEDIRSVNVGTNFLVGLQGKVPGLRVIESVGNDGFPTISVRVGRAVSFVSGTEPLILVDGVPFPDAQSISSLSASMVERVEVLTRAAPQYGSRGSNGVIAIYTKQGAFFKESEPDYLSFKVPGYHKPSVFYSPDYSVADDNFKNPDFRTTIFWKPDLKIDAKGEAKVNFYTADLATKYRIVVEGVTDKGIPVRSVTFITVE